MDNDIIVDDFKNLAEQFYIVFNSKAGKKVLEHFKEMTDCSVLTPNHMCDGQGEVTPSDFVFIREGQNQVIRYIERLKTYYKENR